jgi:hypothetical protein
MRCSISRSPHSGATTKKLNVSCVALGSGTFIVRAVHLPPFDPEWIAGVIRSPSGYRAFRMDASYFIWQALNDENEKLPSIHAIYRERPLDEASALRIAALWRAVLGSTQNYGKDPNVYGDSSIFHFFVGAAPGEHLAGWTSYMFRRSLRSYRDLFDSSQIVRLRCAQAWE